ncbi:MAG: sugar ABC transporter permease [Clostridiales bacterium]|nr:sugar ABC transporter permease [Clostridiales bacterium]
MDAASKVKTSVNRKEARSKLWRKIKRHKELYLLILPVIVYYILFHYKPMYGVTISFMNYSPRRGIANSEWVGLQHFKTFFDSIYFTRILGNTLKISLTSIFWGFPAPIILALLINELRSKKFSRVVQTVTSLPHFISLVVICSMIREFVKSDGIITELLMALGYTGGDLLSKSELFVPIYVISDIWQDVGWGSIIYLAAITGIHQELYEAARVDGAGRFRQVLNITLPGIAPTIIILFIMRMGRVMNVGYEKIILLYNEGIYSTSDVISTYVYRMGLVNRQYSFSAAVGLFNSLVNFSLVVLTNWMSRKVSETSLW